VIESPAKNGAVTINNNYNSNLIAIISGEKETPGGKSSILEDLKTK